MKFFFDGSFPKRLCLAIRILEQGDPGVEIVFKHDKFAPNVADVAWIGSLAGEGGWVVITMDPEILRKPHERAAWDEAGLTGFFLDGTWGNLRIDETAWRFLRWWPLIKGNSRSDAARVDLCCSKSAWSETRSDRNSSKPLEVRMDRCKRVMLRIITPGVVLLIAVLASALADETPKRGGILTYMIPADAPPSF